MGRRAHSSRGPQGRKPLPVRAVHPLVVGHRGASARLPDNTLEAFAAAFDDGADVVEADIRLTADAIAVAIHDPDVSRATGGTGLVCELTLSQIREMEPSPGTSTTLRVPTLEEIVVLATGRGGLMLEIKNIPGQPGFDPVHEGAADAAVDALESFEGPALVASFNPRSIERCLARSDRISTGFLSTAAMDPAAALRYVVDVGHAWVMPQVRALRGAGEGFVVAAHEAGVRVGTWVENDPDRLAELFGWGVDAVATDVPEIAVPIRDAVVSPT
jgi:glycerophosphoryl diester phosphodiesterase